MKEVAKMLKSLGPHYSLKWEWFFDYDPVIRMELTYFNPMTQMIFKCDQKFPQEALNNTDGRFGSQVLDDMARKINDKVKEYWRDK